MLKTKKNSSRWDFWHISKFVIRFLIVAMHDTQVEITDRKQFDKNLQDIWEWRGFFSGFSVLFVLLGFMCVCSLQNVGRGYREENLCLSIGIVRDASPDSITDIKIRKSSQKAPWQQPSFSASMVARYCAHTDQRSHGETLLVGGKCLCFLDEKPRTAFSLLLGK